MAESRLIKIKRGLDLPISGEPKQIIEPAGKVSRVALIAEDYVGLRPRMHVKPGDSVRLGETLFEDKKNPGVSFKSPGGGEVISVNRGERRALLSVVIALSENENPVEYPSYTGKGIGALERSAIKDLLLESGLWSAFRTRPFSKVPNPASTPSAIFITAMDTNPLAADVEKVLEGREEDFLLGQKAVAELTGGTTYLCRGRGSKIPSLDDSRLHVVEFDGPHPSGTPGVHIHFLEPVNRNKTVWHIGYQDVIAIGSLFKTGRLDINRVVSLAGPGVQSPRLIKTRTGACIDELVENKLKDGKNRVISGSVFSGRSAQGEVMGFLGRYHNQISVVHEGTKRRFLGWIIPWFDGFSVLNVFLSKLFPKKKFAFGTGVHGGRRAIVPIGAYERVMPMDIIATHLLRTLFSGNLERAEQLGCLELDEEDLALCTFVCPCKNNYGPVLRELLHRIEKEG